MSICKTIGKNEYLKILKIQWRVDNGHRVERCLRLANSSWWTILIRVHQMIMPRKWFRVEERILLACNFQKHCYSDYWWNTKKKKWSSIKLQKFCTKTFLTHPISHHYLKHQYKQKKHSVSHEIEPSSSHTL